MGGEIGAQKCGTRGERLPAGEIADDPSNPEWKTRFSSWNWSALEDPEDRRRPAYRTIFTLLTRLAPVAYG